MNIQDVQNIYAGNIVWFKEGYNWRQAVVRERPQLNEVHTVPGSEERYAWVDIIFEDMPTQNYTISSNAIEFTRG